MLVHWSIYTCSYGMIASIMVIKIWLKLKQTRQPFSLKPTLSSCLSLFFFYLYIFYFLENTLTVDELVFKSFAWSCDSIGRTLRWPPPPLFLMLFQLTVFCNKCRIHLIELYTVLFQTLALSLRLKVLSAL